MTGDLLGEEGLSIEGDFDTLMEEQRARGRAGARAGAGGGGAEVSSARDAASSFARESGVRTRFTGYETEQQQTTVGALQSVSANGSGGAGADGGSSEARRYLVKLEESPFYAAGGGQVAD